MKRLICFVLLFVVFLTACTASAYSTMIIVDPQATEDQSSMDYYQKYLENYADSVYSSMKLPSGGILVVQKFANEPGEFVPFDGEDFHYSLARIEAWEKSNRMQTRSTSIHWADVYEEEDVPSTWIFFDAKNAEYLGEPFEMPDYTYYDSRFFTLEGRFGRDVIVIVTPAMKACLSSYVESPQYGLVPYDSLGSTPMKVIDEKSADQYPYLWHYGYPIWIFAIPETKIGDDYELHFGDYILTGKDIKAGTWINNGVQNPERPEFHNFAFVSN